MRVTETGEARIRGYLFVLGRSLRTFLDRAVAEDALREVESHLRERLEQVDGPDERAVVESVLAELGPPLRVAQAYSTEMVVEKAVTTGGFLPMVHALWNLGTTSVLGFLWAMLVFTGWTFGLAVLSLAPVKLLFPNNVGISYVNGQISGAGAHFNLQPGTEIQAFGYWIVPVALALGLAIVVLTQRLSRRGLTWLRSRRAPRFKVRVQVVE